MVRHPQYYMQEEKGKSNCDINLEAAIETTKLLEKELMQ